jgi:hypothetical protein
VLQLKEFKINNGAKNRPKLTNRLMTNHWAGVGGNRNKLFQDGGQIKREKDIYHHGPKHILIICHLPNPPSFSIPTTFNHNTRHYI